MAKAMIWYCNDGCDLEYWHSVGCSLRRPLTKLEIKNNLDFRGREELGEKLRRPLDV